jgi:hypothetical protein
MATSPHSDLLAVDRAIEEEALARWRAGIIAAAQERLDASNADRTAPPISNRSRARASGAITRRRRWGKRRGEAKIAI